MDITANETAQVQLKPFCRFAVKRGFPTVSRGVALSGGVDQADNALLSRCLCAIDSPTL